MILHELSKEIPKVKTPSNNILEVAKGGSMDWHLMVEFIKKFYRQ